MYSWELIASRYVHGNEQEAWEHTPVHDFMLKIGSLLFSNL